MKIGFACNKKDLYDLWHTAFGDSDSDIDLFMELCFQKDNAIVCYDGKKLVSMLFLLPAEISFYGKEYPAYYIYAAATSPDYRKRGIMGKMLGFADTVSIERGIKFLFLVPANEHLFDYYEKFGYVTAIRKKALTIPYKTIKQFQEKNFDLQFASDTDKIAEIKSRVLSNKNYSYIKWRQNEITFFCRYSELSGDKIITSDYGYTAFQSNENSVDVYEFCSDAQNIPKLMCVFHDYSDTKEINFNLPVNFPLIGVEQKIIPVGMIKSLSDIDIKDKNVYTGITLN